MKVSAKGKEDVSDVKGGSRPEPGTYHVVVKDIDDSFTKHDALLVGLEVLAGTVKDQEGREHTEFLWLDDDGNAKDQHVRLAMCLGLLEPGEEKEVDWEDGIGRHMIVQFVKFKKKDSDKELTGIGDYGMAMWPIGHKDAKDVPVDKAAIKATQQGGGRSKKKDEKKDSDGDDDWDF